MDNLRLFLRQQIANLSIKKKDFLLLVEDEFDKIFWTNVLNHCNFKLIPQILPSVVSEANNPTTGKGIILKYQSFCTEYPSKLKIAIDSDYDYLLNRGSFNIQNHILQTYTYSIENYFCYAPSLESLCVESTQSSKENIFDFEEFLTEYSKIIYPLFIMSLLYEKNNNSSYSITNFCNDVFIDFQKIEIQDVFPQLSILKEEVENQFNTLKPNFSDEDYEILKANIELKGVQPENCYLFIKGHFLLENLLAPIIKNLTNQLSKAEGLTIIDSTEKQTYFSSLKNAPNLLKDNFNFYNCAMFKKVEQDILNLNQQLLQN